MATRRARVGERRWPTAAAVLLTGALRITLPPQLRLNDAGPALFVVLLGLVMVLILAPRRLWLPCTVSAGVLAAVASGAVTRVVAGHDGTAVHDPYVTAWMVAHRSGAAAGTSGRRSAPILVVN